MGYNADHVSHTDVVDTGEKKYIVYNSEKMILRADDRMAVSMKNCPLLELRVSVASAQSRRVDGLSANSSAE